MAIIDFFDIAVCAEIAALFAAIALLPGKSGYWKLFIAYLGLTILIEAAGYYFHFVLVKPNYPLYNFFMVAQTAFFSFLFFKFHSSRHVHNTLLVCLVIFVLFFIGEGIYNSFGHYQKYSRLLLSLLVVLLSCVFYFSILRSDDVDNPMTYAPFWIITGLFFFYFGTAVMFAFYDSVSRIKLAGNISFYNLVMGSLSCILYGSWIIAFLCLRKQVQSSKR